MLQVDQAVVSLVDKDRMRADLVVISDALKGWYKAISASRTASAMTAVEDIASKAAAEKKVRKIL